MPTQHCNSTIRYFDLIDRWEVGCHHRPVCGQERRRILDLHRFSFNHRLFFDTVSVVIDVVVVVVVDVVIMVDDVVVVVVDVVIMVDDVVRS